MSELDLGAKYSILRVQKGSTREFKVNGVDDFAGTCELKVYTVTGTLVDTVAATLEAADFIFVLDDAVTADWPAYGRYTVTKTEDGEPNVILKGPLYCEGTP